MDARTLKALNASIEKWERIAERGDADTQLGPGACPLCVVFYDYEDSKNSCIGCPVNEATGAKFCIKTPYSDAEQAQDNIDPDWPGDGIPDFRAAAAKEAAFLRALRPIGGAA